MKSEKKRRRKMLQWRRTEARAGQRDPWYVPERDLAYIGPIILRIAALSFDEEDRWEPWFKDVFKDNDLTVDKILETGAPEKLAQMFNLIVKEDDPGAAAKKSGFADLPGIIQALVYARIGQVALSGIWVGVKDVSRPDSDPPASISELTELIIKVQDECMQPSRAFGSRKMTFVKHYARKARNWIKGKLDAVRSARRGTQTTKRQ